MRADSGATRRRQSEKRRGRGRHRVGLGVPARVCQDELSEATFFRVAKAEAPHDDPPSHGRSRYRDQRPGSKRSLFPGQIADDRRVDANGFFIGIDAHAFVDAVHQFQFASKPDRQEPVDVGRDADVMA